MCNVFEFVMAVYNRIHFMTMYNVSDFVMAVYLTDVMTVCNVSDFVMIVCESTDVLAACHFPTHHVSD